MTKDSPMITEYLFRVAGEEIEIHEGRRFPFLAHCLANRFVNAALGHIQNFIWTIERAIKRFSTLQADQAGLRIAGFINSYPRTDAIPTVWLDVTNTQRCGGIAGISRVAKRLTDAAIDLRTALPVYLNNGDVHALIDGVETRVIPDANVMYVIIDGFWDPHNEYIDIIGKIHAAGGRVATLFYDVLALDYPIFFRHQFFERFRSSFVAIYRMSDICLTTSHYNDERIAYYAKIFGLTHKPTRTFALGANVSQATGLSQTIDTVQTTDVACDVTELVDAEIIDAFAMNRTFLSVGTVEPRKGYAITLDAFDKIWKDGGDCRLVIIGKSGWNSQYLEDRIRSHAAFGRRLFWFRAARDQDIDYAYAHTCCLIQSSIAEGFGLPIVEASLKGAAIIASDTPVFREITGNGVVFYDNCDAEDLARKIEAALLERPKRSQAICITWDESLKQLIAALDRSA